MTDNTLISWSLHIAGLRKIADRLNTLAGMADQMQKTTIDEGWRRYHEGQHQAMTEAMGVVQRAIEATGDVVESASVDEDRCSWCGRRCPNNMCERCKFDVNRLTANGDASTDGGAQ